MYTPYTIYVYSICKREHLLIATYHIRKLSIHALHRRTSTDDIFDMLVDEVTPRLCNSSGVL